MTSIMKTQYFEESRPDLNNKYGCFKNENKVEELVLFSNVCTGARLDLVRKSSAREEFPMCLLYSCVEKKGLATDRYKGYRISFLLNIIRTRNVLTHKMETMIKEIQEADNV